MKNEFKVGDLVFELSFINGIELTETAACGSPTYPLQGSSGVYTTNGLDFEDGKAPSLLPATPEIRQALVTLYGEDAVPEFPLRGSELTKRILEKQKYVLCWISAYSDDAARRNKRLAAIQHIDDNSNLFTCIDDLSFCHAVPVDMNGNEITEIE